MTLSILALPLNAPKDGVWNVICEGVEVLWPAATALCPGSCALSGETAIAKKMMETIHKPGTAGAFDITTLSSNSWTLDAFMRGLWFLPFSGVFQTLNPLAAT